MEDLDESAELFEGIPNAFDIFKEDVRTEKEVELHPSPNFTEGKA